MRKLGIIGGMSWISTRRYYEQINRLIQREIEPRASAPMVIESIDYRTLGSLTEEDSWTSATEILSAAASRLQDAGADGLLIAANVMHRVYDQIAGSVDIPVLHVADCVGKKMKEARVSNAALIGTRTVMTESFYRQRLVAHGVDLLPPDMDNIDELDRVIVEELKLGKATRPAERLLKTIITCHQQDGAKAIVLACTELDLVVDVDANILPIFDSTRIHCRAAADWILGADGE